MNISFYLYKYLFFYRYLVTYLWEIGQVFFILFWIGLIIKFKISGRVTAGLGFIFLFITMLFNILKMDDFASLSAQYVFILFTIAVIQQFYHFLKYENK